jgi:branched-chain amino acid transport system permease protein
MLAQQLVNGVLLGATYALFALGFTLTFGVLRMVNLLYGFYFTLGAFVALFLVRTFAWPVVAVLPLAALAAGVVAAGLDWLMLARLRRVGAPELASLMVTLGAVLALYAATTALLGPDIQRFPVGLIDAGAIVLGSIRVTAAQVLILVATVVSVGALLVLMRGSRLGLALRAMAEDPEAAGLMGIDTGRLAALVSLVSGAMAGMGGVLIGLNSNAIQPYMGEAMMLRGFVVVIVGGLGDIRGALIAGLVIGVVEVLTAGYLDSRLKEAAVFAILVAVLWTRPAGLFGHPTARRA